MFQSSSYKKIPAILALICVLSLCISAQSEFKSSEISSEIADVITDFADNPDMDNVKENAEEILKITSAKSFLETIRESIVLELSRVSSTFAGAFAIILISSLFTCIGESFSQRNNFTFVSLMLSILITLMPISNAIDLTAETCNKLSAFMLSFIPAISAVSAAGGNTVSASVGATVCTSGLAFLEILSSRLLIPATKICVSLCAVGAVGKSADLSPVSSFIKNTCMWIAGLIMTIFCGVLSLQTFISTGADSLAMRGIKFTAAKLIPVAGGMVSESLKTVVAGAGYVKSVAGTAAIAYVVYSVLPTVCGILAVKTLLYLSGTLASLTGQKELQSYFISVSGSLNLLYSVCAVLCASFIIILAIFIKTSVTV